jgi:hypothetical protein
MGHFFAPSTLSGYVPCFRGRFKYIEQTLAKISSFDPLLQVIMG